MKATQAAVSAVGVHIHPYRLETPCGLVFLVQLQIEILDRVAAFISRLDDKLLPLLHVLQSGFTGSSGIRRKLY